MLYLLYIGVRYLLMPWLLGITRAILPDVATIVIIVVGMSIAVSAVGIKTDAMGTAVRGGSNLINMLFRGLISAIAWIARTFANAVASVFHNMRRAGYNVFTSVVAAAIVAILII